MAPSPEYDKEPKAPDKNVSNISSEESKVLLNLVNDQQNNSDHKPANTTLNSEVENNKHVSTLDDGQLRALLDEAITYKCPKDREGKSVLFKELLQEAEQDEQQECEAAARSLGRARHQLPHSNSLQDLMAALTAETAPRRHHRHHAAPPPSVSARAIHGGSLPSGVDTSSLLGEEPARGAGYLATVRCVNPPPLAERRVSASDANAPQDLELNRRSKPMFPMTYTARASLEIGSGSVGSGRAVTTTTASNQVSPPAELRAPRPLSPLLEDAQAKLSSAMGPRPGGLPLGGAPPPDHGARPDYSHLFPNYINQWYEGLAAYSNPLLAFHEHNSYGESQKAYDMAKWEDCHSNTRLFDKDNESTDLNTHCKKPHQTRKDYRNFDGNKFVESLYSNTIFVQSSRNDKVRVSRCDNDVNDSTLKNKYRKRCGRDLMVPDISLINPKNVRSMTIGKPETSASDIKSVAMNKMRECNDHIITDVTVDHKDKMFSPNISSNYIQVESEALLGGSDLSIELKDVSIRQDDDGKKSKSFSQYCDGQQKLLQLLGSSHVPNEKNVVMTSNGGEEELDPIRKDDDYEQQSICENNTSMEVNPSHEVPVVAEEKACVEHITTDEIMLQLTRKADSDVTSSRYILKQLPNNAYIFLTLPKRLIRVKNIGDGECSNNVAPYVPEANAAVQSTDGSKCDIPLPFATRGDEKNHSICINTLRKLLFENNFRADKSIAGKQRMSAATNKEVDSAIPFSCITTPEVVASCNTTSSAQATLALDNKPLQPGSSCRAGASPPPAPPPAPPAPPAAPPAAAPPPAPLEDPLPPAALHAATFLPRSVISSSFNGLPLSRPNYGSTDDYKKSLDENGNSLQGFSSPHSGSSQHKKPRRKKSSKNETVIDCEKIDGYRGDKDVNELLRFIEPSVESGRKLGRAKHPPRDDCDDKGKKRSAERRKDKEAKPKRASSLEELSRTTLEELTAPRRRQEPPKAERRSWGDERHRPPDQPDPPDHLELTDFQTVTKRRKPRRRTDGPEPGPPRRPHPPSDRSNDSNDDLDSVHSLPADAPAPPRPAPAPASYADIARTRHNIPDLIESCNFYAEAGGEGPPAAGGPPGPEYPALEARRRARDKGGGRRPDKGRAPPSPPAPPAPDVLGERRPPVVLRSAPAPDLDGVTFGFDINEQLLGRPRCDLVRDAPEQDAAEGAAPPGVLRVHYVPPRPPPDSLQLLHIVDYVGAAWEEVVRCGGGKVRYYSE